MGISGQGRGRGEGKAEVGRSWGIQVWEGSLNEEERAHSRDLLGIHMAWEGDRKPKMSLEFLVCMAERVFPRRGDIELMGGASPLLIVGSTDRIQEL